MIAYKVLTKDYKGRLCSTNAGPTRQLYHLNMKNERQPGCGPLAAFESLAAIRCFLWCNPSIRPIVFRCRIRKSREQHKLWHSRTHMVNDMLPLGTICADSITLLERIKLK